MSGGWRQCQASQRVTGKKRFASSGFGTGWMKHTDGSFTQKRSVFVFLQFLMGDFSDAGFRYNSPFVAALTLTKISCGFFCGTQNTTGILSSSGTLSIARVGLSRVTTSLNYEKGPSKSLPL